MTDLARASLWLLVLLPAVAGALLALLPLAVGPRSERIAAPVSVAVSALTAVLATVAALERPRVSVPFMAGTDLALGVDALAAVVLPTVALVTLLVLVFSAGEIHESRSRFHGLMLVFAASALLTVVAETLPTLLLAWEVMGATSYALIGFWWRDPHRMASGLTAFATTRAADLGLYVAAGAALAGGAGLALADLPDAGVGWRHVVAAGVLVAALGKAAQLPFSFWLSRAMDGPSPVSALLHSAAMVAMGGYLLLRAEPLLAATGWAGPAAAWAGGLTALLLGAVALAQGDLKQLLAASTCAQLGFVVMGAGLGAVSGGTAHLVAHASTKSLLFLAAGAWLSVLGTKNLAGLRDVARRRRVVGWSATLGLLSLAGVAPLALWATKDAVLKGALEESPLLYVVGLAGTVLSAAYAAKVLVVIWRRVPEADRAAVESHHGEEDIRSSGIGPLEAAPLVPLAAGAALLGLLALPPAGEALAHALGESGSPVATPVELAVSAVLAFATVLAVVRRGAPEMRWAQGWLGLEQAVHAVVVRPTLALARILARVDDRVLDGGVDAAASATVRAAERAARLDDARVDGLVEALARQVRRLGQLARRPQTGLLHQYYLQAVVLLAAVVLVLVTVR